MKRRHIGIPTADSYLPRHRIVAYLIAIAVVVGMGVWG